MWFDRSGDFIVALGVLLASKDVRDFIQGKFEITEEQFRKSINYATNKASEICKSTEYILVFGARENKKWKKMKFG